MNKVITINLNGRAYQLEEAGYGELRRYLDQAAAKLDGNPDKEEIMADFEQAIAEKCETRLSPRKDVVSAAEIAEIIEAMGPVDAGEKDSAAAGNGAAAAEGGAAGSGTDTAAQPPKRLYRIPQGEWIAGVCNGLAAYFGMDVALMRIIFVLLVIFTHGFWGLIYIVLMILMPVARTEEQLAAARGAKPLNAHDFIEQAKSRYAELEKEYVRHHHDSHASMPEMPDAAAGREEWRKWKEDLRSWRLQWKADMRRERDAMRASIREQRRNAWRDDSRAYPVGAGMGFSRFIMGLALTALFVLWIIELVSVLRHGMFFGIAIAAGHPAWISIIFVCALFYAIALPFKLLMRNTHPRCRERRYSAFADIMESLFFLLALYLITWAGSLLFPEMAMMLQSVGGYLRSLK